MRNPFESSLRGKLAGESVVERTHYAHTHAGMAHFGGTGPAGKTCRECVNFKDDGYLMATNELKPGRCAEYLKRMGLVTGPKFPHSVSACKHFVDNPNAKPMFKPIGPQPLS